MKTTTAIPPGDDFKEIQEEIIQNINNPKELEKLYRHHKIQFQGAFKAIYPGLNEHATIQIWHERLNFEQEEIGWGRKNEFLFVVVAAFITGLLAKIPWFLGINYEYFIIKDTGLVVFPVLMAYFSWRQKASIQQLIVPTVLVLLSAVYINFLPNNATSDSIILACIHLPIFLWTILGFTFIGGNLTATNKKIDFLRFNGDFVVMTTVIVLSGILFTGLTMGLFTIIGIKIESFYAEHIGIWGLAAVPVLSTFLVQNNPQLVSKISPVIAKIFTPLVFVTLVIFLVTIMYTGKNIYDDRNFLLLFNALLIGVMAIILFSVTEATKNTIGKINGIILCGLSILTIVVNLVALSAIAFRLVEFGITPNRVAVLGANLLIFINLILVARQLLQAVRGKSDVQKVEQVIAAFLPVYGIWTALVTFGFPLLFGFK